MDHALILEVCKRPPIQAHYPYAKAFLDSHFEPVSPRDIDRLLRLMAYDMMVFQGGRGVDGCAVYARCLQTIHAIQGEHVLPWTWAWKSFSFSATLCPQERFSGSGVAGVAIEGRASDRFYWRQVLESLPLDEFFESARLESTRYPPPRDALLMASLLCLVVAFRVMHVHEVGVWVDRQGHGCHTLCVNHSGPPHERQAR